MVFQEVVSSTLEEIPTAVKITLRASKVGKSGVYEAKFVKREGQFKLQEFEVKEVIETKRPEDECCSIL
ncbi:hypothetical protein O6P43_020922 [Quillaja saponaria]|uniref:Uncharacterized protein n=1 Tax=Quillaja saponaria TaxID=32244 RepID=A0AAD7LM16_QUISA|nr:hypothetical protein O6P43_020922 [Quillaja saponaria]